MAIPASPEAIARLGRYAEILAEEGVGLGLLGPRETDRIVPRHVLESCALLPFLAADGLVIDVGAGAGLPGIPIACLRAGGVVLIESNERRAWFLRRAVDSLGISVDVALGRAEELARTELRESCAAVVARALAPPATALELCLPFVTVHGVFVTLVTPGSDVGDPPAGAESDGETTQRSGSGRSEVRQIGIPDGPARPEVHRIGVPADVEALEPVSRQLGGGRPELRPLEVPGADAPRWAMMVPKLEPTPDRFPRRTGVPARRPLG